MLAEFRVKNFRSLREEQVLSMAASKDKEKRERNAAETGIPAVPAVLHSAALYGANASGKSTIIHALQIMLLLVMRSANFEPDAPLPYYPFRLNNASSKEPTSFEATFIWEGKRYQYGFSYSEERIHEEYLYIYQSAKPRCIFERVYNAEQDNDNYKFGTFLTGQKIIIKNATRKNALFLSTAAQLNHEQLTDIYKLFSAGIVIFNELSSVMRWKSFYKLEDDNFKNEILLFLQSADISIADICIEKVENNNDITINKQEKIFDIPANAEYEIKFLHKSPQGSDWFSWRMESNGTRNVLLLLGPIIDVLSVGSTLVVDELDTSLHPFLVQKLVALFHEPKINIYHAQLIFSTHDTSLMTSKLMRRDQIWFVEKDNEQTSHLYGLAEFSVRKNEAVERGYFQGRYGGLPILSDWQMSPHEDTPQTHGGA